MNRLFALKRQFIIFLIIAIVLSFSVLAQEGETSNNEVQTKTYVASTLFSSMHNSDVLYRYFSSHPESQIFTPDTYEKLVKKIITAAEIPVSEIYFYISPLDFFKSNLFVAKQNEILSSVAKRQYENVSRISSVSEYLDTYAGNFNYEHTVSTVDASKLDLLRQIDELCSNHGTELKIILTPCYIGETGIISYNSIKFLKEHISQITSFYDFTCSPLSEDPRFFYNNYELRNTLVNEIASSTVAPEKTSLYENFGHYTEKGTYLPENDIIEDVSDYSVNVPVLLYHHIGSKNFSNDIISAGGFKAQLEALKNAGFNTVSLKQLNDYVYYGTPLPEKPVCITFDDGYESNYKIAYPIMKKLGMKGTIFVIGSSVGKDTYKDTGHPIYPHFNLEQAYEMIKSGVMQIHSHTFDMHQSPLLETGEIRESADILPSESVDDYMQALEDDYLAFSDSVYNPLGITDRFIAYPHGIYTDTTEAFFADKGVTITLSTRSDTVNTLIKGMPQSLRALSRITINDNYTSDILINMLNSYYNEK